MTSTKNHEVKSIISKKQGFWLATGLIIAMLTLTGKFNFLASEDTIKLFTDYKVNISLPSIDFTDTSTMIYLLLVIFVLIIAIGIMRNLRDY